LDELQLDFAADGREVDVVDIAQTIPPLLGVVDQGRLELNVRGMSAVSAALPLLEIWVALLRSLCVAESNRTITGEMVAVACEGDRIRISCIAMILMSEPWPSHCGEGVGGGTWWVDMSDEVLDLHEARTVADVLKVRGLVQSRPRPTLQ
jgi:hypothetical protein